MLYPALSTFVERIYHFILQFLNCPFFYTFCHILIVRIPATSYLVPLFTLIYLVLLHLLLPSYLNVPCYLNNRQRYCSVWPERDRTHYTSRNHHCACEPPSGPQAPPAPPQGAPSPIPTPIPAPPPSSPDTHQQSQLSHDLGHVTSKQLVCISVKQCKINFALFPPVYGMQLHIIFSFWGGEGL